MLKTRWVSLIIFPAIILLTGFDTEISLVTAIAFFASCFLLSIIQKYGSNALPVWAVFFIFIFGYFLKFFCLFAGDVSVLDSISPFVRPMINQRSLQTAYEVTVLAYFFFCGSSIMFMRFFGRYSMNLYQGSLACGTTNVYLKRLFIFTLVILTVTSLVSGAVQSVTGIGVMGNNVVLPYRLSGIILYSRFFITYCLLLLAFVTDQLSLKSLHKATMLLLFIHVFSISLLMTSRGAFIGPVLALFVMWTVTQHFTKRRLVTLAGIVCFVALIHPIISELRNIRINDPTDFVGSLSRIGDSDKENDTGRSGFLSLFTRITGIEQVVLTTTVADSDFDFKRIGDLLFDPERSFPQIFTQDIEGRGRLITNHGSAPSLVGAFFLLGGTIGVVGGVVMWVFIGLFCWRIIPKLFKFTAPVALGSFFSLFLISTTEGTLEEIPLVLGVNLAFFFIGERFICSKFHSPKKQSFPSQA